MDWHGFLKHHVLRLKGKLLTAFLLAAVLPFIVLSFTSVHLGESALKNMATAKLTSDLRGKEQALTTYLDYMRVNIGLQGGRSAGTREGLRAFLGAVTDAFTYKMYDNQYRPYFQSFLRAFEGAARTVLVGTVVKGSEIVGKIVYASSLEAKQQGQGQSKSAADLGNKDALIAALGGAYLRAQDPNPIAKAYALAIEKKAPVILDFQSLKGEPASLWMAAPILAEEGMTVGLPIDRTQGDAYNDDEDPPASDTMGVIIMQVFPDSINRIIQSEGDQKTYLSGKNESGAQVLRSRDDVLRPGQEIPAYLKGALAKNGIESYDDPSGNRFLVASASLPEEGFHWKLIGMTDEAVAFAGIRQLRWMILVIGVVGLAFILSIALFAIAAVVKPVNKVVANLKDIAEGEGDLTARLDIKTRDEIGDLAFWFNLFLDKIQKVIKDISRNADILNRSSGQLTELSHAMSAVAQDMSSKSNDASHEAQEVSANVNSVAAAMEQASTNVSMIAAAAEEMTATINEIAQNSEKAKSIAEEVAENSRQVSEKAQGLGNAVQDITKVTETITEISEQTNLLALNATIEAARAGEAGKGFAVVANEIKELARQTAQATLQIKKQIGDIQGAMSGTVTDITQISGSIRTVNEVVASISASVEEQSATTREIAGNVSHASLGLSEVNQNVGHSSAGVEKIAHDIVAVNQMAANILDSSSQVDSSSGELALLAEQLHGMVGKFKI
ncbi:MAG: methyl-accepting chemotaxis protein [Desulfobacteraceae bacterium]|nr:MAG: methyl-accepting chemotaxis protein [Desulfobacteraceae bacterium]